MYNRFKRLKGLGLTVDLDSIDKDTFETIIMIDCEFDILRRDEIKANHKKGSK